jgi:hypothetical protein
MPVFVDACTQTANPRRLPGPPVHKPPPGGFGSHDETAPEPPQARERALSRRRPPGRSCRRFEEITQLEIERSDGPQAVALDSLQRRAETGFVENRQAIDRVFETPGDWSSRRCPPIFEKRVERRIYLRLR